MPAVETSCEWRHQWRQSNVFVADRHYECSQLMAEQCRMFVANPCRQSKHAELVECLTQKKTLWEVCVRTCQGGVAARATSV